MKTKDQFISTLIFLRRVLQKLIISLEKLFVFHGSQEVSYDVLNFYS